MKTILGIVSICAVAASLSATVTHAESNSFRISPAFNNSEDQVGTKLYVTQINDGKWAKIGTRIYDKEFGTVCYVIGENDSKSISCVKQ